MVVAYAKPRKRKRQLPVPDLVAPKAEGLAAQQQREESGVDPAMAARIAAELGVEVDGGVCALIRHANALLDLQPTGSLGEQAEVLLTALVGEGSGSGGGAWPA